MAFSRKTSKTNSEEPAYLANVDLETNLGDLTNYVHPSEQILYTSYV